MGKGSYNNRSSLYIYVNDVGEFPLMLSQKSDYPIFNSRSVRKSCFNSRGAIMLFLTLKKQTKLIGQLSSVD